MAHHFPNDSLPKPPALVLRFLRFFCHPDLLEDVEGDLMELFEERVSKRPSLARMAFIRDVLLLFRPGIVKNFWSNSNLIHTGMLRNNLLIAWRNALKYKGYTAINLLGLLIGVAASAIIFLWVQDEYAMDAFHEKKDRTFLIWRNMYQGNGEIITTPGIPQPLEFVLEEEYPEVEDVTLVGWEMEKVFQKDEKKSYESGFYASPEFFSVFSYPLLVGDANTMLSQLNNVVISRRVAEKLFGSHWMKEDGALGKMVRIDDRKDFIVTGVFENPSRHSSLQFDWILPAQEYMAMNSWVSSWYNGGFGMVFTLKDKNTRDQVASRIEQEINKHTNNESDERIVIQQLSESYLHSRMENGVPSGGRIEYVRVLSVIAIFLVIIASMNFMSLATARAGRRAKEIGLRKVLGAGRKSLRQQFFVEAILMSAIAGLLALVVVWLALPYFNELTGKQLSIGVTNFQVGILFISLVLITGLLSGSYPALLLSSFKIIESLKGTFKHSAASIMVRRGMVVFQFVIAVLLIMGTLVVNDQMQYILTKNLGLDRDNLIYLQMEGNLWRQSETYKEELLKIPGVKSVTTTSGNPLDYGRSTGGASWDGKDPSNVVEINVLTIGDDWLETFGVKLLQGRMFSSEFGADSASYLVNEVAAKIIGYENPVGGNLRVWGTEGKIVGVINDFHMASMYEPIEPLIVRYDPSSTFVAFIKTQGDLSETLAEIEDLTTTMNPSHPFRYRFLDDEYQMQYQSEMTLSSLTKLFAVIAIIISCLGLLGLASYTASQRAKEIGIRKVHGAEISHIIYLLSREYGLLMILAFVLAIPVGYYYLNLWLQGFEFRVDLDWFQFVMAGIMAFVVGALTVSIRSYQAASCNPVDVLKDE